MIGSRGCGENKQLQKSSSILSTNAITCGKTIGRSAKCAVLVFLNVLLALVYIHLRQSDLSDCGYTYEKKRVSVNLPLARNRYGIYITRS
jgi:hypothetical protein